MALTREERKLLHQKAKQPTFGAGKPDKSEGYDGDISFRKVEGSGTVEYVKQNGDWIAVASSGEMPTVRIVGGSGGGGGTGITVHGSLSGLGSDDHKQYILVDGTRAFTGAVTVGSDGAGHDVTFHSGTGSDLFFWDASEEVLQITGTNAATALDILDGDVRVVDTLYFYDRGGESISSNGSTLSIAGGSEIDLTATAIDVNGTFDASGTVGLASSSGVTTIGSSNALTVSAAGVLTVNSATDATSSTSGSTIIDGGVGIAKKLYVGTDLDVDGTTNLDAVDIDGNVQLDGTFTIGTSGNGHEVTMHGSTSGNYIQYDDGNDELVLTQDTKIMFHDSGAEYIGATSDGNLKINAGTNLLLNSAGSVDIDTVGALTLDSGAAINLEPASGSTILLDGTINFDAGVISTTATANNVAGTAVSFSAGNTTAGTYNNVAGGSLTFQGGQGKGSGAGGDIIFKTANAGVSGPSLNALATALTISDDLSSTFTGAIIGTTIDASTDFTVGSTVITDDSIVMTPSDGDTVTVAATANGALTITTVDTDTALADISFVSDGSFSIQASGATGNENDLKFTGPLNIENLDDDVEIKSSGTNKKVIIDEVRKKVLDLLKRANVTITPEDEVEISSHYGLEKFEEVGCLIINKINREYCKKIIVQLSNQKHPVHHHIKKEETFELLYGDCELNLNGKNIELEVGKPILISRGVNHSFASKNGCVVEEVSTTHHLNDSKYENVEISSLDLSKRKVYINLL